MCKPFEIAEKTVREYISKEIPFSYNELLSEIIKRGGINRVAPVYSIKDFLEEYIEDRVLFYDNETRQYKFMSYIRKIYQKELEAVVLD